MNKKELKDNEKYVGVAPLGDPNFEGPTQNKTSKDCSNLISNHQPLISDHNAITLIALVITIIVMLILVGVTVTIALNGGLFTQAKDAARKTQIANIKERVQSDIWEKEAENKGGGITTEDFRDILGRYFDGVPETADVLQEELNSNQDYSLGTKEEYGPKVDIKISDLYNGTLAKEDSKPPEELGDAAGTDTSYVGYYADVDGDEAPDGIIYADLAFDGSGTWNDNDMGNFSYKKQTGSFKQYVITNKKASSFGDVERDVIKANPESDGEDRFYVMALEDVDTTIHTWYLNANSLANFVGTSDNDFGKGKENTKTMIDKWKDSEYGTTVTNDMWGVIQNKKEFPLVTVPDGKWFVPSKAEWAAFGWLVSQDADSEYNGFGVDTSNYNSQFGLKQSYWSSSICSAGKAYVVYFITGYMSSEGTDARCSVRLSATF